MPENFLKVQLFLNFCHKGYYARRLLVLEEWYTKIIIPFRVHEETK